MAALATAIFLVGLAAPGFLLLRFAGGGQGLHPAVRAACAWLLGGGLYSSTTFVAMVCGIRITSGWVYGSLALFLILGLMEMACFFRAAGQQGAKYCVQPDGGTIHLSNRRPGQTALVLTVILIALAFSFSLRQAYQPFSAMDAWGVWGMKAKLLYLHGRLPQADLKLERYTACSEYPRLSASVDVPLLHPLTLSYPLHIPFLETSIAFLDAWSEARIKVLFPFFYLTILLILAGEAHRRLGPWPLFLTIFVVALDPMLFGFSHIGYAETSSAAVTLAAVILITNLTENHCRSWLAAGLLSGLSAWTKNEGIPVLLLLAGFVFVFLLRSRREHWRRDLVLFLFGAAAISLPWILFSRLNQLYTLHTTFLESPITMLRALSSHLHYFPLIIADAGREAGRSWTLCGLTLLTTGLLLGYPRRFLRTEVLLPILVLLSLPVTVTLLLLTAPSIPELHALTKELFRRLPVQNLPLAYLLVILVLSRNQSAGKRNTNEDG